MVENPVRAVRQGADALCILAIDRQPLFLAALARLLSESSVKGSVQQAARSDQVFQLVDRQPVDVVLCDAHAEPLTGIEVASAMTRRKPGVPVVLLGELEDAALVADAIGAGAAGFFTKDISLAQLLAGIGAVLNGHLVISRSLGLRHLRQEATVRRSADDELDRLTLAERGVLTMIGQARSVDEIARVRGSSQKTVRNQVASIYRKLKLRNRTEAMLCAVRLGMVDRSLFRTAAGAVHPSLDTEAVERSELRPSASSAGNPVHN